MLDKSLVADTWERNSPETRADKSNDLLIIIFKQTIDLCKNNELPHFMTLVGQLIKYNLWVIKIAPILFHLKY